MKILKFGGKSLAAEPSFETVIKIIAERKEKSKIAVVVSAIGNTTNLLEKLLEAAKNQEDYSILWAELTSHPAYKSEEILKLLNELKNILEGVALLKDYSLKIKDKVKAFGELISSIALTNELTKKGINAKAIDSRNFFKTDAAFGSATLLEDISGEKTLTYFKQINSKTIPVVTGFIGSTLLGETTTLGRNGSNYSASLLAQFLHAEELQNFTHVDGIFTANPDWVRDARKIDCLSYEEASELVNLGASILHEKAILPLVDAKIPLRILNTLNSDNEGTLISKKSAGKGIKSLSVSEEEALIRIEGKAFLGVVGIDGRIFGTLAKKGISIGAISQGSSQRGVGFLIAEDKADIAIKALQKEFETDIEKGLVSKIEANKEVAVISIIGQELADFDKPYSALIRNKIVPLLFNSTITGKNVGIVVRKKEAKRALNVLHGQVFGVAKKVNIAIFGKGNVGGSLISQIIESARDIEKRKGIILTIFAVGDSKRLLLDANGIKEDYLEKLNSVKTGYTINDVLKFAEAHHLENRIAVDNTGVSSFIENYIPFIKNGFDLVSSNKIGNTIDIEFYDKLRRELETNHREYLYEANVGAGLPLIDTIKLLHLSGENITRIRGVFSGSLSYLFNTFATSDRSFSQIVKEAAKRGYTEPDPREDLSGVDVGRKLLILARELDLKNELENVAIQNLIPEELRELSISDFMDNLETLDPIYEKQKSELPPNKVLKYVAELSGDLQQEKGNLKAELIAVPKDSPFGQLKGSDNLFEIHTESYGAQPIIIQGAGAGAAVTARGVFGDILRLAKR